MCPLRLQEGVAVFRRSFPRDQKLPQEHVGLERVQGNLVTALFRRFLGLEQAGLILVNRVTNTLQKDPLTIRILRSFILMAISPCNTAVRTARSTSRISFTSSAAVIVDIRGWL
jgi:hypothetical protein